MPRLISKLLIGIAITSSCAIAGTNNLPSLGDSSSSTLSIENENRLGKQFMMVVRRQLPLIDDDLATQYLQTIGDKLASHSNKGNRHLYFFLVDNPTINAFAGPGGYIGVNTGLILNSTSESELAGVLAHEITHVTQRHIARMINQQKNLQLPTMGLLLATLLVGLTGNPGSASIATGAAVATMAGSAQSMINYTRNFEYESDRIGMDLLYKSGFDPNGMPDFFNRMQKYSLDYGGDVPEYLRTHPMTSRRISESLNRVNQYPKRTYKNSLHYYLVQARLKADTDKTAQESVNYFKGKLQLNIKNPTYKQGLNYGYSLALNDNKQYPQAYAIAKRLHQKNPNEIYYQLLEAHILFNMGKSKQALDKLKLSHELNPNYLPVSRRYAQTLIQVKQYKQAETILKALVLEYPNEPKLFVLLSKTQAKQNDLSAAYQSRATALLLLGYQKQALIQLRQALRTSKSNKHSEKKVIEYKIQQVEQSLNQPK